MARRSYAGLIRHASSAATTCSAPGKSTVKRDTLARIETRIQQRWEAARMFEVDAPDVSSYYSHASPPQKYTVTFPFPYMNGRLHLGHAFSLSKCEFAAGYQRLKGKRVLFPFGFHGTGMPIKTCADKLRRELCTDNTDGANTPRQWDIMRAMGVPDCDIPLFADAKHWLRHFPQLARADLKRLGVKVDWRRSFITTDVNPYFDSFVRWQFRRLKAADKICFGKRYTIYSPLDGQPCMDHDRQTGEGVAPQEYTLIKLELQRPFPPCLKSLDTSDGLKVYLTAATLRPETMYGQTNCFVGPTVQYGAYRVSDTEVFVCTERAARNMRHQHGFTSMLPALQSSISGRDLVGCSVRAPLAKLPTVPVLPMAAIKHNKGTGIVTSVPSDSPDDYLTLMELKKKPHYFGVDKSLVASLQPIPVIQTAQLGNMAAPTVCQEMQVNSPRDVAAIAAAKEKVYRDAYYSGHMAVGEFAGQPVHEAKPRIREHLIASGDACPYWEPESECISRSGDECVVALTDQWYLNYGEEHWKRDTKRAADNIEFYHPEVRAGFNGGLEWLREWACARSYGLGTRLPWDEEWLIESLSDSSIYTAFYTVAHLLQGNLEGSAKGQLNIEPHQITDAVWDYIFASEERPPPADCEIQLQDLQKMRREFQYFYPVDLRVSGKDLLCNHLLFYLYNHVALFDAKHWPRSIRANGHLLINGEKMSKSTGNFMTLQQAVEEYTADGTRLALAESGDGVDDANFDRDRANSVVLKLFSLKEWMGQVWSGNTAVPSPSTSNSFDDDVFLNDINYLIQRADQAYDRMLYYDAVKYSFHELLNAKDRYVYAKGTTGAAINPRVLERYMNVQALLLAPITPHFSEHVWQDILAKPESVMQASWPHAENVDKSLLHAREYIDRVRKDAASALQQAKTPSRKKKNQANLAPLTSLTVAVAKEFPEWQSAAIRLLRSAYSSEEEKQRFPDFKTISHMVKADPSMSALMKKHKKLLPFMRETMDAVLEQGPAAFDRALLFDELAVLEVNTELLRKSLGVQHVSVVESIDHVSASPGSPAFIFS